MQYLFLSAAPMVKWAQLHVALYAHALSCLNVTASCSFPGYQVLKVTFRVWNAIDHAGWVVKGYEIGAGMQDSVCHTRTSLFCECSRKIHELFPYCPLDLERRRVACNTRRKNWTREIWNEGPRATSPHVQKTQQGGYGGRLRHLWLT